MSTLDVSPCFVTGQELLVTYHLRTALYGDAIPDESIVTTRRAITQGGRFGHGDVAWTERVERVVCTQPRRGLTWSSDDGPPPDALDNVYALRVGVSCRVTRLASGAFGIANFDANRPGLAAAGWSRAQLEVSEVLLTGGLYLDKIRAFFSMLPLGAMTPDQLVVARSRGNVMWINGDLDFEWRLTSVGERDAQLVVDHAGRLAGGMCFDRELGSAREVWLRCDAVDYEGERWAELIWSTRVASV